MRPSASISHLFNIIRGEKKLKRTSLKVVVCRTYQNWCLIMKFPIPWEKWKGPVELFTEAPQKFAKLWRNYNKDDFASTSSSRNRSVQSKGSPGTEEHEERGTARQWKSTTARSFERLLHVRVEHGRVHMGTRVSACAGPLSSTPWRGEPFFRDDIKYRFA